MHVVIFSKIFKDQDKVLIQSLFDILAEERFDVSVYKGYLEQIRPEIRLADNVGVFNGYEDFANNKIDIFFSLGGDGTFLSATTEVRDSGVPILGLNLGRLGFLASVESKYLKEAIIALKRGMYILDERTLLHLESNLPLFGDLTFALNDCTILKRDTSSMVRIKTYINGAFLNSYWADGLIISTPTGSTGYSLSCGGPIIFPNSENFVITPVAPHNLNVRPIIISDSSVISFEVEGRGETFLCTLDSRFESITSNHQLAIRKCNFSINMILLHDHSFMQTIREKLDWGKDVRN